MHDKSAGLPSACADTRDGDFDSSDTDSLDYESKLLEKKPSKAEEKLFAAIMATREEDRIRFENWSIECNLSLLFENKVAKKSSSNRQSSDTGIVHLLTTSLLEQDLDEAMQARDKVIQKALFVVLIFAMGARDNDGTKGSLDTLDIASLVWGDIEIKMMNGEAIQDLVAIITIRTENGEKLDPNLYRQVHLKATDVLTHAQTCPVSLMMTHALCIGAVSETSVDKLLHTMAQRQDKVIVWKTPDNPIFCLGRNGHEDLFANKQSGRDELDLVLKEAIKAAQVAQAAEADEAIQKHKAKKLRRKF